MKALKSGNRRCVKQSLLFGAPVYLAIASTLFLAGCATSHPPGATENSAATSDSPTNIDRGNPEAFAHYAAAVSYAIKMTTTTRRWANSTALRRMILPMNLSS